MYSPNIPIISGDVHRMFLRIAYGKAMRESHDPVTKTGAILVQEDYIIGMGVNHFPEGVIVTPELLADKKRKSDSIIHAECAGIGDARTRRLSTHGSTLYTNFLPCEPCTEEIIAAGIAKVYGHHPLTMRIPERWIPSLDAGIERLLAHGIDIALVEGHLGGVENVFDGEYWLP